MCSALRLTFCDNNISSHFSITQQATLDEKMPIQISILQEQDIPSAVHCIQVAFEDDPYNNWVFDKKNFSLARNTHSLSIRCRWGMKHALFHVAKDPTSSKPDEVLGVACWLPPSKSDQPQSWTSYFGDWWLWWEQVKVQFTYSGITLCWCS